VIVGEGIGMGAGVQELDLEQVVARRGRQPDQLVQAMRGYHAASVRGGVRAAAFRRGWNFEETDKDCLRADCGLLTYCLVKMSIYGGMSGAQRHDASNSGKQCKKSMTQSRAYRHALRDHSALRRAKSSASVQRNQGLATRVFPMPGP
jgi:hypothetical protein